MSGISTHETTHDTIHDLTLTQKQVILLDFRNAKRKNGGRRGEERRSSLRRWSKLSGQESLESWDRREWERRILPQPLGL